jgi:hypothetical protein
MLKKEESSRNFENLGDLVEPYQNKNFMNRPFFSLKNVGQVIQKLVSNFYTHPFDQPPISKIDRKQTMVILSETVIRMRNKHLFGISI